jgi:hypothetical protein
MEGVRQDGGGRRWRFLVCLDPDVLFLTFKEKKKIEEIEDETVMD